MTPVLRAAATAALPAAAPAAAATAVRRRRVLAAFLPELRRFALAAFFAPADRFADAARRGALRFTLRFFAPVFLALDFFDPPRFAADFFAPPRRLADDFLLDDALLAPPFFEDFFEERFFDAAMGGISFFKVRVGEPLLECRMMLRG